MSEGEHHAPATLRDFRMVRMGGAYPAGSAVMDSVTPDALRPRPASRAEGADNLDALLFFNERDVLTPAGRRRMDVAPKLAAERFEALDANRRAAEALAADDADIPQLEEVEKAANGRKTGGKV